MDASTKHKLPASRDGLTEGERRKFRLWLQQCFTERCKRNPRYSLRAFARNLEVDPSTLSQVLSGKRALSKVAMETWASKLSARAQDLQFLSSYVPMQVDTFAAISDWYHYALLELTCVSGFEDDPKWIAKRLSITVEEAKAARDRLLRLGLLLPEAGSVVKSARHMTNAGLVNTSAAHRELQRQVVGKALHAIDDCAREEKDITSMTMAIDITQIDKARELIRKFRHDMCELLEEGDPSRVYNLAIQLYPVSQNSENMEKK